MRKTKIADKQEAGELAKIYNDLEKKTKTAKTTIKNSKIEEKFEADVMSKNILRLQMGSIEKQLKILDNRLDKGFLKGTKIVEKLRSILVSIWNRLQGIYGIIGRRK
jgi:uncharacterized protein YpuA (DUF1002 family)